MGLTFTNRPAVLKGRSTVVCPCHLEDSRGALNALDPQTLAESLATIQVIDELCDRAQEPCLLLGRQRIEINCEARQPGVGRQRRLRQRAPAAGLCPRAEGSDEFLARCEPIDVPRRAIGISIPLACLPFGGPEPGLRGVDELLRAQQDAIRCEFRLEQVANLQVRSPTDVVGQRELTLRPQRGSCHAQNLILRE